MKFVEFTAPNGKNVYINPEQVEVVRYTEAAASRAKTEIVLVSGFQMVVEDVETVTSRLEHE